MGLHENAVDSRSAALATFSGPVWRGEQGWDAAATGATAQTTARRRPHLTEYLAQRDERRPGSKPYTALCPVPCRASGRLSRRDHPTHRLSVIRLIRSTSAGHSTGCVARRVESGNSLCHSQPADSISWQRRRLSASSIAQAWVRYRPELDPLALTYPAEGGQSQSHHPTFDGDATVEHTFGLCDEYWLGISVCRHTRRIPLAYIHALIAPPHSTRPFGAALKAPHRGRHRYHMRRHGCVRPRAGRTWHRLSRSPRLRHCGRRSV